MTRYLEPPTAWNRRLFFWNSFGFSHTRLDASVILWSQVVVLSSRYVSDPVFILFFPFFFFLKKNEFKHLIFFPLFLSSVWFFAPLLWIITCHLSIGFSFLLSIRSATNELWLVSYDYLPNIHLIGLELTLITDWAFDMHLHCIKCFEFIYYLLLIFYHWFKWILVHENQRGWHYRFLFCNIVSFSPGVEMRHISALFFFQYLYWFLQRCHFSFFLFIITVPQFPFTKQSISSFHHQQWRKTLIIIFLYYSWLCISLKSFVLPIDITLF